MSPEQTDRRLAAERELDCPVALKRAAAAAAAAAAAGWLTGTRKARPLAGFGLQAKAMETSEGRFFGSPQNGKGKKIDWAQRLVTRVVVGIIRGWHGWDGAWMPYVSTRRLKSFWRECGPRTVDSGHWTA